MKKILIASLSGLLLILLSWQCGAKQPAVTDTRFSTPLVDHTRFTEPCAGCHEETRLAASVEISPPTVGNVNILHGLGASCESCHQYVKGSPSWAPKANTHNPPPTSCWSCHALAREGQPHAPRGDCVACHAYPAWPPK